jgi:acyl-coenzyme A thioesterase 13
MGFDKACHFELVSSGEGKAKLRVAVTEAVTNPMGTLHGGAIATLVDQAGTMAIMSADRQGRPGMTTDLNVSYFIGAPIGTEVVADAKVLKIGKTLAFVEVDVRRESDGVLLAQGRMTKYQGG